MTNYAPSRSLAGLRLDWRGFLALTTHPAWRELLPPCILPEAVAPESTGVPNSERLVPVSPMPPRGPSPVLLSPKHSAGVVEKPPPHHTFGEIYRRFWEQGRLRVTVREFSRCTSRGRHSE